MSPREFRFLTHCITKATFCIGLLKRSKNFLLRLLPQMRTALWMNGWNVTVLLFSDPLLQPLCSNLLGLTALFNSFLPLFKACQK